MISIWIPIIITIFLGIYIISSLVFSFGQFIPGFFDEAIALLIIAISWAIWGINALISGLMSSVSGIITLIIIISVIVYVIYRKVKK